MWIATLILLRGLYQTVSSDWIYKPKVPYNRRLQHFNMPYGFRCGKPDRVVWTIELKILYLRVI